MDILPGCHTVYDLSCLDNGTLVVIVTGHGVELVEGNKRVSGPV